MDFPCWLYVFALCSILPTGVHCQCGNPGPGRCNANNSQFISDREVASPSALSCPFQGSLCNYRQGCQDKGMSPWTAGEGYSQASQIDVRECGQKTYSVLESRWIQFSIPVCLQFSFSRYIPVALAVFFEPYPTGSTEVITLLAEDSNKVDVGKIQDVNVTINKATGKVLFRIYGGAPGNYPVLKLYPVTYQDGRCETPGCSFTGDSEQMCGWTAVNWKQENNAVLGVRVDNVTTTHGAATLTSPLTRATGENHRDCLTFKFRLKKATDSLTVEVKMSGVITTVWSAKNLTSTTQVEGQVRIETFEAYQIVFIGHKPQTDGRVIVSNVSVSAKVSQDCAAKPKEAAVNVTWPLGNHPTPSPSSGSSTDDGDDVVLAIAIAGAAFAILIISVIVGVYFCRQRRNRKGVDAQQSEIDDAPIRAEEVPSTRESTYEHEPYDDIISVYNRPGNPSPPSPYNTLHDVMAVSETSAEPFSDITMTERASYINMTGEGQAAASPYQNTGHAETSVRESEEMNVYLELV